MGNYANKACQDYRLIVRDVAGPSIALCPPLVITEAHVDEIVDAVGKALDKTLDYVRKECLLASAA